MPKYKANVRLFKEVKLLYSPKIRDDLIPILYQIKQAKDGKPMTKIVDEILRPAVFELHEKLVEYNAGEERSE